MFTWKKEDIETPTERLNLFKTDLLWCPFSYVLVVLFLMPKDTFVCQPLMYSEVFGGDATWRKPQCLQRLSCYKTSTSGQESRICFQIKHNWHRKTFV